MPCYEFEGVRPIVDPTAFVHPTAVLIGDVRVGAECFVGPCACLRGDLGRIELEPGCNVQDACVLHCFPGRSVRVERDGHVGHAAVLHGCTVGPNAMVGINAVVMDGVVVGESSLVAAMAFVRAGTIIPPRSLVAGVPAAVLRTLTDEEIAWKTEGTQLYRRLAQRHRLTARPVEPLPVEPPDRVELPRFEYRPKHEQA